MQGRPRHVVLLLEGLIQALDGGWLGLGLAIDQRILTMRRRKINEATGSGRTSWFLQLLSRSAPHKWYRLNKI
eukprot:scaffold121163_cov46-Prasinocladus_malaysianus.AAC.1